MAAKRRSPLEPGAYGKPQRWHQILTAGAQVRADKREAQQRENEAAAQAAVQAAVQAANDSTLFSGALAALSTLFR